MNPRKSASYFLSSLLGNNSNVQNADIVAELNPKPRYLANKYQRSKIIPMTDLMRYQIRVRGHLSPRWTEWFDGLEITNLPNGDAVLTCALPDQAALYGVLNRVRDLGLILISLNCIDLNPSGIIEEVERE